MKKNKKFIVELVFEFIIFFMGVLYLMIPAYYGLEVMSEVNTNNLFISAMLIYSSVKLGVYILNKENPTNENIYLSIVGALCAGLNILLNKFAMIDTNLAISMLVFTFAYIAVKLFTVDYYHDRDDEYYLIELPLLIVFIITEIVIVFNLFNDSVIQTIMLGFFIIIMSMIESINSTIKLIVKSKRFIKKIKLK